MSISKKGLLILTLVVPMLFSSTTRTTEVDLALSAVPNEDMQLLLQDGWKIYLEENINDLYEFDFPVSGITDYNTKSIYIKPDRVKRALLHEIGHAVDYELGNISQTEEFYQLFEQEKSRFIDCTSINDRHEIENEKEYFASVYQNIILNYEDTANSIPNTVKYIERYTGL